MYGVIYPLPPPFNVEFPCNSCPVVPFNIAKGGGGGEAPQHSIFCVLNILFVGRCPFSLQCVKGFVHDCSLLPSPWPGAQANNKLSTYYTDRYLKNFAPCCWQISRTNKLILHLRYPERITTLALQL